MTKVRMKTVGADAHKVLLEDHVYDVDAQEAEALVAGGFAEVVDEEPATDPVDEEPAAEPVDVAPRRAKRKAPRRAKRKP